MKGRNSLNSKKREISLLAKTIRSLKEYDYENDLQSLKNELAIKTYDRDLKKNSSVKIYAYNQKKIFPKYERNSKQKIYY
jgi:hypothetical protein